MMTSFLSRWFILFMLMIISSNHAFASIETRVDRNPVGVDESFTLTLEIDNGVDDEPDLSALSTDFDIRNRSQGTSVQIINGRSSKKSLWHFVLIPKRTGQLRIPAIVVGGQQSEPIEITVTAEPPVVTTRQDNDLFLEVSTEHREIYVQQQVVYTARLFHAVELGPGSSLSEPRTGSDLVVERLGDGREYQTSRDGRRYMVIERRYALYPQKSGQLTIDPILFDGSVVEQSRSRNSFFMLDPFNQNARPRRIRSSALELTVKSIPSGNVNGQWLPARNLQLAQHWSPEVPKFVVGEPVTRTLALIADGLTAAQLPVMNDITTDGIKQYPDQPALADNRDSNGVTGTRQEKVALIPTQVGRFILPSIEIPWWNTTTDHPEIARLPAYTIEVLPGMAAIQPPVAVPLPATTSSATEASQSPSPAIVVPAVSASIAPDSTANRWPWLIAFLFALGWASTALAWWHQQHRFNVSDAPSESAINRRKVERQIAQACRANNPQAAKAALLSWGKFQWPEQSPVSLIALAERLDAALAAAVNELDRVLYAGDSQNWNGDGLWRSFNDGAHERKYSTSNTESQETLVPLNLSTR
ncbi:conserved exported hypothetical protein [Gammaproteobacteria bacterium]